MSKKLIAVAAAAALALTALVAPANAAGANLTIAAVAPTTVSQTGLTSTTAFEVAVPSQDVLRATATVTSRSILALEVSTRSDNASVAVTSTGSVKLITAAQLAASTTTSATGTASLALTANDSGKVTFYAYNTTTTSGSITVVESGTTPASNTVWVKGTTDANNAYKLAAVAPTLSGLGATVNYTATVVDMFGNALTTPVITGQTLGGNSTGSSATNMVYSATTKVYEGSFTNRTTAGATALLVNMAISADTVTAFGAKTTSAFVNITGQDLQAAITALNAQITALNAQLAALTASTVTKAQYNKLVRKFNRTNPAKRVARVL